MFIRRLVLRDFRSYHHAELDLDPGLITLVGPNAVGKTNL
ncbi:MAG TPA: AAA family ATPase, partial [Thermaerobacter sp.]